MVSRFEVLGAADPESLSSEWDSIAAERREQISSGSDVSFSHVIAPAVIRLLSDVDRTQVLDVGSGTGELTLRLAAISDRVVAVEPSLKSMNFAREHCREVGNVIFINSGLSSFSKIKASKKSTAAVASMVLSATVDLTEFSQALSRVMASGSAFIATLPHPAFWPRYWGYESCEWFRYDSEIFIRSQFRISAGVASAKTTHVHRPISMYLSQFSRSGFDLVDFQELLPAPEIHRLYPEPWRFPRFIAIKWVKR